MNTTDKDALKAERELYFDLARRRTALGWTQKRLAIAAGVSQNMVCYLENGLRHGTVYMFLRLLHAIEKEEQRRANARTPH